MFWVDSSVQGSICNLVVIHAISQLNLIIFLHFSHSLTYSLFNRIIISVSVHTFCLSLIQIVMNPHDCLWCIYRLSFDVSVGMSLMYVSAAFDVSARNIVARKLNVHTDFLGCILRKIYGSCYDKNVPRKRQEERHEFIYHAWASFHDHISILLHVGASHFGRI